MKINEINKFIKNQIEPKLNGYLVHKDLIYKVESSFFLKYYCIVSKGNEEDDIYASVAIQPLFVKSDFLYKTFGFNLTHRKKTKLFRTKTSELWDARKENLVESFNSICNSIIDQGEPFLKCISNSEDFYNYYKKDMKLVTSVFEAVAYSTVLYGTEKLQNLTIQSLIDFCSKQIDSDDDIVEIQIRQDALELLNANTTNNRINILKSWANETISHLKLPGISYFD
ncbi:MAG: hypothetical protein HOP11_07945 [Saprospiraceae bacterium]|nr:hypothetical protein [Saprospiraceae bacterium]